MESVVVSVSLFLLFLVSGLIDLSSSSAQSKSIHCSQLLIHTLPSK